MAQLNINVTPEFSRDLKTYMKQTGMTQKSAAIRAAVKAVAEQAIAAAQGGDYKDWLGLASSAPLSEAPRFKDENDLWV